jgi:hypothetical protein
MPETFKISSFPAPATTSTRPTLRVVTLDQLRTLLGTHERRRDKDGCGWSGATYKPGTTRANANVIEWSVAGADIEHVSMDEYMEMRAGLVGAGLAVILYSTYGSTPENFRFRLAIPLTKPVPKDRYTDVWHRINEHLLIGKNDPQTKDPSRMLYTPAAPEGVATVAEYISGLALDWEKLPEAPATARKSTNGTVTSGQAVGVSRDVLLFTIDGASDGEQRGMALRAARSFLAAGKSVDETADLVWRGLQASPIGDPENPWTEEQARAIVEDLADRVPTPLEEWPELQVGDLPSGATNGHRSGPTVDDEGGAGYFSPPGKDRQNGHTKSSGAADESSTTETVNPRAAPTEPMALAEVTATFRKWLYMEDDGTVLVTLASVAANRMQGDPLWLMIVGASSGGKTEILNATSHLGNVHLAAVVTEAALLSGTSKKEAAKGAKGGLLREIGPFGVLLLKDFTSTLSMKHEARAALLAALREIYDGSWTRHVGTDGGRTLHWQGKLGLIACCTTIIDTHHAVMAAMGERFLLYRLPEIDPKKQAKQALRNAGREREMRQELAAAVGGLFAEIKLPEHQPELSDDETDRLVALASLAAYSRSHVERDGRTREIELIPDHEAPARLSQALRRLYGGLLVIGVPQADAWPLVVKVGLDCMPKLRRSIFEYLVETEEWTATTTIAEAVGYPTQTARRSLEDLAVHGLVLRKSGGKGKSDTWLLAQLGRGWYAEARGSVPENSPNVDTSDAPDDPSTIKDSAQCTQEEFSGTPCEEGENDRHCWRCGAPLLEELDTQCSDCGWMQCFCGTCGCEVRE